jgi:hypothetical protein
MEVTKWLKPSERASRIGDGASVQAATQLIAERGKAHAGNLRHPFVTRVGNNVEQFGDSFAPDRGDDAKFGKVSPGSN